MTVLISGLPTIGRQWNAYLTAADPSAPLNSLVTHVVAGVLGLGRVSSRLPALAGYLMMTAIVFEVVRRRSNALVGLSAALLPSFTGAAEYAHTARCYGLMLGLFALALFSWSEAASGRARRCYLPVLTFALAAGIWAHYFAVLAFVPIAIGEAFRFARTRRVDWGIIVSLIAAAIAVLPLFPLLLAVSTRIPGFWARRHGIGEDLGDAYRFVAGFLLGRRALLLFAIVAAIAVAARILRVPPRATSRTLPVHEIVAGLACVFIPIWGVFLSLITDVFVPRYTLMGVVGIAIVVPLTVCRGSRTQLADVVLCLGFVTAFTYTAYDTLLGTRPRFRNPMEFRPLLTKHLAGDVPVVVTDTLFLETWYYTPADHRRQLKYVADPPAAMRLSGSDSADIDYLAMRNWAPIDVEDWATFAAAHRSFRVYTAGPRHWQLTNLRERGATLREIGPELGYWLYDVELPAHAAN